jgi:hypothetical protein
LSRDERVVVPAIPQRRDDLGEFVGTSIALGMAEVEIAPEVSRLDGLAGCDQVPAGAAAVI